MQVVGTVVRPELLLVLAHHESVGIRAAVIKLLQCALQRSAQEEAKFVKNFGLILLANQMQPYRSAPLVVESCLSLCTGLDVSLERLGDDPLAVWPEKPTAFQLQSMVLLLTLLPNSAVDPALFNHLASLVRKLCSRSDAVLRLLVELGLVECLAKTIVALAHTSRRDAVRDVLTDRQDEIMMDGVHRILVLVAARFLTASGTAQWIVFQDAVLLLHYVERTETLLCGPRSRCVRSLHEAGCVLLNRAVDMVQDRLLFNRRPSDERGPASGSPTAPSATATANLTDKLVWNALPPTLNRKLNLDKAASKSELMERLRALMVQSVDHVMLNVGRDKSDIEMNFAKGLLANLVRALSSILERPKCGVHNATATTTTTAAAAAAAAPASAADWSGYYPPDSGDAARTVFWTCRDTLKWQLNRLTLFMANPVQEPQLVCFLVRTLHEDPCHEDIIRVIPSHETDFR